MAVAALLQLGLVPGTLSTISSYRGRIRCGFSKVETLAIPAQRKQFGFESERITGLVIIGTQGIIRGKRRRRIELAVSAEDENSAGSSGGVAVESVGDVAVEGVGGVAIEGVGDVAVEGVGDVAVEGVGDVAVEGVEDIAPAESEDVGEEQEIVALEEAEDVGEELLSPEDEEDRENIQEILRVVELLRTKRDMTFNEVRLTITIEDPREVERRKLLNIEDERGCSKEDLGLALVEVYEGRVPKDRTVLRELTKEMLNWPNLEDVLYPKGRPPIASPYAKVTDTGVDPRVAAERARVDWDSAADIQPGVEQKKELSDVLPPAVGFSFLYLLSALPIIIGIAVVAILFFNSLQ